jgi:hypothetical protein
MAVEDTYRFDRGFTLDVVMIHFNPFPSFTLYLFSFILILPLHVGHHLCVSFQSRFRFEDYLPRLLYAIYFYRACHLCVFLPRLRTLLGERIDIDLKPLLFNFIYFSQYHIFKTS